MTKYKMGVTLSPSKGERGPLPANASTGSA